MKDKNQLILYSFRRCPYAMRARLALSLCNIEVQLREVVLRDKPAELLHISPKGTVPVLLLGNGQIIEQSLDIMLWAVGHKAADSRLTLALDAQLQLIALHDQIFKPLLDRYKYPERHLELSAQQHQYNAMYWLESHISNRLEGHTHLFGDHLSLADLAIVPFVRQCAAVDSAAFVRSTSAALQDWLARLTSSALFESVMSKYPQWRAGDPPIWFGGASTPSA
ncbi:glutathione S-transferase N-terminal domain-containing protein [Chitinibacter sp. FCG-7]|uniref:Glutathione S-transferase N-terminal domain-containing protein n=1 Tax=Chitinibacter mangrovi TaxID=3153927 RepID=A0AAU7FAW7_9NEIS